MPQVRRIAEEAVFRSGHPVQGRRFLQDRLSLEQQCCARDDDSVEHGCNHVHACDGEQFVGQFEQQHVEQFTSNAVDEFIERR